jgi:ribosomal protein S26
VHLSGVVRFAVCVTTRVQAEKALHFIETATPSMVMAQMLDCLLSTVAYMLDRAQVSTVACLICKVVLAKQSALCAAHIVNLLQLWNSSTYTAVCGSHMILEIDTMSQLMYSVRCAVFVSCPHVCDCRPSALPARWRQ